MTTQLVKIGYVDDPAIVRMFGFGAADAVIDTLAARLKAKVHWAQRVLINESRLTFNLSVGGMLVPARPMQYRCHFKKSALQTAEVLVTFQYQGAIWHAILQIDSVTRWACKNDDNGLSTIYRKSPWND